MRRGHLALSTVHYRVTLGSDEPLDYGEDGVPDQVSRVSVSCHCLFVLLWRTDLESYLQCTQSRGDNSRALVKRGCMPNVPGGGVMLTHPANQT